MTDKELEQQLKEKDAEIAKLKQKLNARNPAFNGHLVRKAEGSLDKLKTTIANAIYNAVGNEVFAKLEGRSFRVSSHYSSYSGTSYYIVFTNKDDEEKLLLWYQDKELRDFTQSLENFAWAVNNGQ